MRLWQDFMTNEKRVIDKWVNYFPFYETHFNRYVGQSVTMLEIGVQNGGSLQMWQRYFGPFAKIIGIDIQESCKDLEQPGIFIRIGDARDKNFLQSVIDEFGLPDIVLDDGAHRPDTILAPFKYLYPKMHKNSVYMVEDLQCSYWPEVGGGSKDNPATFVNITKNLIDLLYADNTRGAVKPNQFTRETKGIHVYDGIICIEKGDIYRKETFMTGQKFNEGLTKKHNVEQHKIKMQEQRSKLY